MRAFYHVLRPGILSITKKLSTNYTLNRHEIKSPKYKLILNNIYNIKILQVSYLLKKMHYLFSISSGIQYYNLYSTDNVIHLDNK